MTMRGSIGSMITLGGWGMLIAAICALAALRNPEMWIPAGMALIAGGSAAAWIAAFRIEVAHGVLRYSSPFGRTRSIELAEIESVALQVGGDKYRDRFKAPIRLAIKPITESRVEGFEINLKAFRNRDAEALMRLLSDPSRIIGAHAP